MLGVYFKYLHWMEIEVKALLPLVLYVSILLKSMFMCVKHMPLWAPTVTSHSHSILTWTCWAEHESPCDQTGSFLPGGLMITDLHSTKLRSPFHVTFIEWRGCCCWTGGWSGWPIEESKEASNRQCSTAIAVPLKHTTKIGIIQRETESGAKWVLSYITWSTEKMQTHMHKRSAVVQHNWQPLWMQNIISYAL